jgi:hypothetical protein
MSISHQLRYLRDLPTRDGAGAEKDADNLNLAPLRWLQKNVDCLHRSVLHRPYASQCLRKDPMLEQTVQSCPLVHVRVYRSDDWL